MKKVLFVFLLVSCSFAGVAVVPPASDFLGLVPDAEPRALAERFVVIGQMNNGVLVIGTEAALPEFNALGGKYLDGNPHEHEYWRVHLFNPGALDNLSRLGMILDFDGSEYLVRGEGRGTRDENWLQTVKALPAMVGPVRLKPMVLKDGAPFFPPVVRDPTVEALVAAVNPDSVLGAVRRLQNYRSRYSTSDSCRAAANWIAAKFRAYGCDSVYLEQHTSGHAPNAIGIKYGASGQRNPYAIIDGHFDSYQSGNAPGADDNASGTVAAIEACRVMRDCQFTYDVRYIGFSGEEFGLYGSEYYAGQARSRGDSILGVFNFDMIAYVDNAPENLDMVTKTANPPCRPFADFFIACADTYTNLLTNVQMVSDNQNSDHGPFWSNGYLAFCGIEDFWPVNPWYHTTGDSIGAGYNNNAWCALVIQAGVAALATICEPMPMNAPRVSYFHNRIDDIAGNNNQKWDAGESIAVYLTLRNSGSVDAHGVTALLSTTDPYVTLYQTGAAFGTIPARDTACHSVPYTMKAAPGTPREHIVNLDLTIAATETTWHNTFSIQVGEYLITDPVPDGPRTPPLYWAYDDVDASYPEHPTYNWVEIRSQGTRIAYSQNDEVQMIALPSGFGPLKFYDQRYTQVSISADGWICPGNYTTPDYSNTPLPDPSSPPGMICLFWDDLYPTSGGGGYGDVYYYHDAANHRFIVEYDSVAYYGATSVRDKVEAIIYDTTVVTPTGHNAITCQYMTASGVSPTTVGIEDPTRAIAIQDYYAGTYAHGAAPIVAGRAIKYVTTPPTAVLESPGWEMGRIGPMGHMLRVTPMPVRSSALIRFTLSAPGRAEIGVFDRAGKRVADLSAEGLAPGVHTVKWDTRSLPGGIYFVRLATAEKTTTAKAVVTRE